MKFSKAAENRWSGAVIAGMAVALVTIGVQMGCKHHESSGSGGIANLSSLAYKGHPVDTDMNALIARYPGARGTRLDDCITCHLGGTVRVPDGKGGFKNFTYDACNYCHLVEDQPAGWLDVPTSYAQTLNPYGTDYLTNGRNQAALGRIEGFNSDGDGFANLEEIQAIRFPGNAASFPGQADCPRVEVSITEMKNNPSLPKHTQFMLANASRQQFDDYVTYKGVKIKDLLRVEAGVDLDDPAVAAQVSSIQIVSPDGFAQTFSVAQIKDQFPDHYYYPGFGVDTDATCAFVNYPANTYGLAAGQLIPNEQWHLLAYEREGLPLDDVYIDYTNGKIVGEGPLRNAIPPWDMDPANPACDHANPAAANFIFHPDWGENVPNPGCGWATTYPYINCRAHNAGFMAKGAVGIKIVPVTPPGVTCEEFDVKTYGWALVNLEKVAIYGFGIVP